jgi:hypothetical protein
VTSFVAVRATIALAGILVFVYGIRANSTGVRWAGIGVLAAAFVLRFFDPAKRR